MGINDTTAKVRLTNVSLGHMPYVSARMLLSMMSLTSRRQSLSARCKQHLSDRLVKLISVIFKILVPHSVSAPLSLAKRDGSRKSISDLEI